MSFVCWRLVSNFGFVVSITRMKALLSSFSCHVLLRITHNNLKGNGLSFSIVVLTKISFSYIVSHSSIRQILFSIIK